MLPRSSRSGSGQTGAQGLPDRPCPGPILALAALLGLAAAGAGCSDDVHRDRFYGSDMGTTVDLQPLEAAAGREAGSDADIDGTADGGAAAEAGADASDAAPDTRQAGLDAAPETAAETAPSLDSGALDGAAGADGADGAAGDAGGN